MSEKENDVKIVEKVKTPEEEEQDKKMEIAKEEEEFVKNSSGTFGLTVVDLENLMGAYKERGTECRDLEMMKNWGGDEEIMKKLKTDPKTGIDSLNFRKEDFGTNEVFQEPVPPFCSFVWEALQDTMIRILIVAAIVQIILGATLSDNKKTDWIDGMSIVFAVLVVTLVGSITDYNKAKKFHELNDLQKEGTMYQVIRNGSSMNIKTEELLVGDLINISVGEIIPADMFIIYSNGVKVDESALTGESDSLKKEPLQKCLEEKEKNKTNPPSPCLLSGTNCVEGAGQAIVIAVGDHSQKGIIRRTVDNAQENNQTPLEEKLEYIAKLIGYFGMASGAITLIALFIRFGIEFKNEKDDYNESKKKSGSDGLTNPNSLVSDKILNIILLCVAIIVVAIPEGLPLAVSLSLAFSIKKLMDQNNLVRKMHSCETMGGANFICTDKTGTLTRNEMNIFKVYSPGTEILIKETMNIENAGSLDNEKNKNLANAKIREPHTNYFTNEEFWNNLKASIALNIEGSIKYLKSPNAEGDNEEVETKNKTDKAFIDFLYRFQSPISEVKKKYIENDSCINVLPFDSKNKRMMTAIKSKEFPTGYRVFSKGGGEKVKEIANKYIDINDGQIKALGDQELNDISDKITAFNKEMLRSLYVAYRDITEDEFNNFFQKDSKGQSIDQHDMIFVCVVGIRDSLRNGVKEAVEKCRRARVTTIMITGDNIITATAIAKEASILDENFDLSNPKPEDMEEDPELTNKTETRDEHLKQIIDAKPKAITGNTFFAAIHGLYCASCEKDTNECTCAKTKAEAEKIKEEAKQHGKKIDDVPVREETIRDEDMKTFKSLTKNLRVMARSQPIHKYAVVLGLKKLGFVVGVTGDGTNDAPALSKADVGFAMFAGTDIAKDASDIIIMDNNFASIVVAIIYGRNIYDNIRKFLQFQLTVNFAACFLVFICACIGNETPLNPIEMLWVNLIMDSLGSLALATEPPYEELLDREPTKKDESIINGKMWKHIIIQSLAELVLLICLYLLAPKFIKENNLKRKGEARIILYCYGKLPGGSTDIDDIDYILYGTSNNWSYKDKLLEGYNTTQKCGRYAERQDMNVAFKAYCNAFGSSTHIALVFNVFVVYTLFNEINARVLDDSINIFKRIQNNIFFPLIVLAELALQAIIVQFGNQAFKVVENGLTGIQWGICFGFGAITFILSLFIKFLPIDVPIQSYLDNKGKDNKVANEDDIKEIQKSVSEEKLNKSNHSIKKMDQENAPLEPKQNIVEKAINSIDNNVIKPLVQKNNNNSIHRTESYLRKNKPEMPILNGE